MHLQQRCMLQQGIGIMHDSSIHMQYSLAAAYANLQSSICYQCHCYLPNAGTACQLLPKCSSMALKHLSGALSFRDPCLLHCASSMEGACTASAALCFRLRILLAQTGQACRYVTPELLAYAVRVMKLPRASMNCPSPSTLRASLVCSQQASTAQAQAIGILLCIHSMYFIQCTELQDGC